MSTVQKPQRGVAGVLLGMSRYERVAGAGYGFLAGVGTDVLITGPGAQLRFVAGLLVATAVSGIWHVVLGSRWRRMYERRVDRDRPRRDRWREN